MNIRHHSVITMSQRYLALASTNLLLHIGLLSFSSIFFLSLSAQADPIPAIPSPSASPTDSPIETRSPCDVFSTRQEAQAFFERNPVNAANLDPNRDGRACDQLSASLRTDGHRISSRSTSNGWLFEIWQSSTSSSYSSGNQSVYYIRAWQSSQPDTLLTTGNFSSAQAAYQYFVNNLR